MQKHIYGLYFPCRIWGEKVLLPSPVSHIREHNYPAPSISSLRFGWQFGFVFCCLCVWFLVGWFDCLGGWGARVFCCCFWVCLGFAHLFCLVLFLCVLFCCFLPLLTYTPKPKIKLSLNLGSFSLTSSRQVEKSTRRAARKLELRTKPTSPTCHGNISLPGCTLGWTQTNVLQDAVSLEQKKHGVASASPRLGTGTSIPSSWHNTGTGFVWTCLGLSGGQAGGDCCSSWFSFSLAMHNCVV